MLSCASNRASERDKRASELRSEKRGMVGLGGWEIRYGVLGAWMEAERLRLTLLTLHVHVAFKSYTFLKQTGSDSVYYCSCATVGMLWQSVIELCLIVLGVTGFRSPYLLPPQT